MLGILLLSAVPAHSEQFLAWQFPRDLDAVAFRLEVALSVEPHTPVLLRVPASPPGACAALRSTGLDTAPDWYCANLGCMQGLKGLRVQAMTTDDESPWAEVLACTGALCTCRSDGPEAGIPVAIPILPGEVGGGPAPLLPPEAPWHPPVAYTPEMPVTEEPPPLCIALDVTGKLLCIPGLPEMGDRVPGW